MDTNGRSKSQASTSLAVVVVVVLVVVGGVAVVVVRQQQKVVQLLPVPRPHGLLLEDCRGCMALSW